MCKWPQTMNWFSERGSYDSGPISFVHARRNAHWIIAQRTLCFWSHTEAHANYLRRKLGHHFLHDVAVLHFLETVSEAWHVACKRSRPRRPLFGMDAWPTPYLHNWFAHPWGVWRPQSQAMTCGAKYPQCLKILFLKKAVRMILIGQYSELEIV